MKKYSRLAFASVLVAAATVQYPALAQQQAPAASNTLEEVVVTAEKREESAQKTDISMNVYSAPEIVQKGVIDLQSLSQTDTNLIFNRNGGEAALAVRGITTNNTTELGNPSVPVGVDNFFVNRAAALDSMLYDIERVEVLLGPQGTLWGRSATGGLVNITSAKPTKATEASASLELGNYDAVNVNGMLNIPVNDWLQVRVAAASRRHDGYRINTYLPPGSQPDRADDEDSHSGRVTVAFEPTDNFHGWVNFQIMSEGGSGPAVQGILFTPNLAEPAGDVTLFGGRDINHGLPDLGDPSAFPMYGTPWQRISDKVAKWNFAFDGLPGGATITYFGGYDTYSWQHSTSSFTFFSFLSPTPNLFLPIRPFIQSEAPTTQNHELRFTSGQNGFFTWQAGLYYFKELNSLISAGIVDPGSANAMPLLSFQYDVDTESKAAYGQGALHFTDTSRLSLGIRYSKDTLSRSGLFALPVFGIPPGPNGVGSYSSSKTTWHVGYDYDLTPTNLLYAKVDTGYKPGGFESCGSFNPENVQTEEVGSKNRWAGGTMQWNVAAFYSNYKDQQIDQFIASCPTGSVTTNAGKSTIYGMETDFKALVENVGTFDLGFSYLHAVYETLRLPPSIGNPGAYSCGQYESVAQTGGGVSFNCILDGNNMVSAPKYVVSAGFDHTWELAAGAFDFRLEGRYTGTQYFDPFNYADTTQPGYTLINSYLSYNRDNWKVGLYGRNLGNKAYLNYAQEQTSGGASQYNYAYGAPRVFGIRFEVAMK